MLACVCRPNRGVQIMIDEKIRNVWDDFKKDCSEYFE